jgi:hypothetical protein
LFQQLSKQKLNAQSEVIDELWQSIRGVAIGVAYLHVTHLSYLPDEREENNRRFQEHSRRFQELNDGVLELNTRLRIVEGGGFTSYP